ncbi:iron reductase domain protein [Parathielavia hyrcaniae]|uniref:Iron reductase domain protein n=1 Tax=Parathielavia hyrcaniae TaxID=113614 RepID=A0AAN6PRI9_9PEZI|nr:iron reductase domain protein [Parathielavia hyrcaniae]
MQLVQSVARICAFVGLAPRQFEADSSVFEDPETGLTFASYTSDRGITFRVAIPDLVPETKIFDTVLQIVSPNDVGWAGWAWGGHMTYNPLAVAWANGTNNVALSSRIAYGYFSPPEYPDATYTVLKTGTHINVTHWQWGDDDVGYTKLDPQAHTPLAFAFSDTPVDAPGDETITFGIHAGLGHPIYDLAAAKNAGFAAKVGGL